LRFKTRELRGTDSSARAPKIAEAGVKRITKTASLQIRDSQRTATYGFCPTAARYGR